MVNRKKVGVFLAAARKRQGLKQSELAELLDVSDKTVSRWETGQTMPDYSQVLRLCQLLQISVYDFLAGEYGTEEHYRPTPRAGSIEVPAYSAPIREKPTSTEPATVSEEPPQPPKKKGAASRITEITLMLLTVILGAGVLLFGGLILQNSREAASSNTTEAPTLAPTATPKIETSPAPTPDRTPAPTDAPSVNPSATPYDEIAELFEIGTVHRYGESAVAVLPVGELPPSLKGRKQSDEELLALKDKSPEELRAALSTVEDVIAWFRVTATEMWDSDPFKVGSDVVYDTPSEKLSNPSAVFATDSISVTAAWLLQDDYAGCGVLGVCDVSNTVMNAMCVGIPIDGGWYIFNMAACTEKGSFEDMLDAVAVRTLSDLHPYLAAYSREHDVNMTEIVFLEDLDQPIMFTDSGNEKHWTSENAIPVPEP